MNFQSRIKKLEQNNEGKKENHAYITPWLNTGTSVRKSRYERLLRGN